MPLRALLLALFLLSACIPHDGSRTYSYYAPKPVHLLTADAKFSDVKIIYDEQSEDKNSAKTFAYASERLRADAIRLLKKQQRWSDQEALVMHLEIERIRLRRTAAVLLFYQVSGSDEMRVKLWVTEAGRVVIEKPIETTYKAGGYYDTQSLRRRVQLLSEQIVRKALKIL